MAFQIADDLEDQIQDKERGEKINVALLMGLQKAHGLYHEEIGLLRAKSELISIPLDLESLLFYKFGEVSLINEPAV